MIKDKKNMKKRWKRIISNMIAIALVIISSIPTISIPVKAEASVDGKLITVGGKTVTKNMKIDDVKKMFGEPHHHIGMDMLIHFTEKIIVIIYI